MNILDRITAYKIGFVERRRAERPVEAIKAQAEAAGPGRGFARPLRGPRDAGGHRIPGTAPRVVAEIKRASPSKGLIRAEFDPAALAQSYEAGGATALSVLTDEAFFGGSIDDLARARAASALPILRKEFMIDAYQVYEARAAGADAILLIAGLIDWPAQRELRRLAAALGLDVLIEIHAREELEPALELEPDALGINNRDLRSDDFRTDLSRTATLVPDVPEAMTLISESGVHAPEDVARLATLGVDALLIGERLMREPDPGAAIAALLAHVG